MDREFLRGRGSGLGSFFENDSWGGNRRSDFVYGKLLANRHQSRLGVTRGMDTLARDTSGSSENFVQG